MVYIVTTVLPFLLMMIVLGTIGNWLDKRAAKYVEKHKDNPEVNQTPLYKLAKWGDDIDKKAEADMAAREKLSSLTSSPPAKDAETKS